MKASMLNTFLVLVSVLLVGIGFMCKLEHWPPGKAWYWSVVSFSEHIIPCGVVV